MHFIDHIVPAGIVLVDFSLNRIPFSRRHLCMIVPMLLIYGADNIAWSLIQGSPIYKPLDPLKPLSYVIAVALPIASCLLFLVYECFVTWRNRRYDEIDQYIRFEKGSIREWADDKEVKLRIQD